MAIRRKLAGEQPESPDFASILGVSLYHLALIDMDEKRDEEACVRLREAVQWQRKALASNPTNQNYRHCLATHLSTLVVASRGRGDAEGVIKAERELAELRESDPATVALDARLAANVRGEQQPRDNLERLQLAQRAYDKALHAAAAKLWADALDADPKLAEDRQAQHRYNAACAAALAGSGQGKDVPAPDDAAKAKLREQARAWLQAELAVWTKFVESGPPQARPFIVQTLQHWQNDTDLAGIREAKALEALPEAEREPWRALWAGVDALLARARNHARIRRGEMISLVPAVGTRRGTRLGRGWVVGPGAFGGPTFVRQSAGDDTAHLRNSAHQRVEPRRRATWRSPLASEPVRCPNCGSAEYPANAPEGPCPICRTGHARAGDTAITADLDATTAPHGQSLEPTRADSKATGTRTPGPVPDATLNPETATVERTPGPTDPEATIDGNVAPSHLPRGTAVRYFGDYEIQKERGRGGMGVVYKARQVSLNRPCRAQDDQGRSPRRRRASCGGSRNEAEGRSQAARPPGDRPGVRGRRARRAALLLHEVRRGRQPRRAARARCKGRSLWAGGSTSWPRPPRRSITLDAWASCTAISKPANILVDAEGHPHVTDFGLAKRVEGDVEMTASGAILGTPAYMSPEQANGRRGSITTATDVYGLGAILYALLTGKAPFGGSSVMDTLDAVRTRPPEPPTKFNANAPRDLETICLKCLAKDPRRRYPSAHELAADLHQLARFPGRSRRRVGIAERSWLWCKRKPAMAALAAAVLLAGRDRHRRAVIAVQAKANRDTGGTPWASNILLDQQRIRAEDRQTRAIDAVKKFREVVVNEPELKYTPALHGLR